MREGPLGARGPAVTRHWSLPGSGFEEADVGMGQ